MPETLLSSREAANQLGITVPTLYDWLAKSDTGEFRLRGQPITIHYFQGGARGQGKIQIAEAEIEKLQEAMRVHPQRPLPRRQPVGSRQYPGIHVPLGRPD